MISLVEVIIAQRRAVVVLFCLVSAFFVPGLLRLESDNSPSTFAIDESEAGRTYQSFRAAFGSDRVVRLVARGGAALWSTEGLGWWSDFERSASRISGVENIVGPVTLRDELGLTSTSLEPAVLRAQLQRSHLSRAFGWTDRKVEVVSCLAVLAESSSPVVHRRPLLELARLASSSPSGVHVELVGLPMLSLELDRSGREIAFRYLPVLIVISIAAIVLCLGRFSSAGTALLLVAASLLAVHGTMGLTGNRLNLITSIAAPLLFAIGLATSIHVLLETNRCFREGALDPGSAIVAAYRSKGWAVFWSGTTTVIGFGSLMSSRVPPVRELGFWVSFGLVAITVSAFAVLPALLAVSISGRGTAGAPFEVRARSWGRRVGVVVTRHPSRVLVIFVVIAITTALGLPRLGMETNALRYLDEAHPVRASIRALEEDGITTASAELLFDRSSLPQTDAAMVTRLAEIGSALEELPQVTSATSLHSLLAELDPGFGLATLAFLRAMPIGKEALASFLVEPTTTATDGEGQREHGVVRMSLGIGVLGVEQLDRLTESINRIIAPTEARITGRLPLMLETQRYLLSTMMWSGGTTLALVTALMILMLGRVRMALLAMTPNLAVIVVVFGSMGWSGSPLDIATVMVGATVLGLAIDYTIHSLCHYRRLVATLGTREALVTSLEITMPAYLLSGMVLLLGFGVCSLSSFTPVAHFGVFSALAIASALAGVILVLPALVCLTTPR